MARKKPAVSIDYFPPPAAVANWGEPRNGNTARLGSCRVGAEFWWLWVKITAAGYKASAWQCHERLFHTTCNYRSKAGFATEDEAVAWVERNIGLVSSSSDSYA